MIHDGKPLLRGCHSGPGPVRVRVRSGPAVWFRSVWFRSVGLVLVGPVPAGLVPAGPVLVGLVLVGLVPVGPVPVGPVGPAVPVGPVLVCNMSGIEETLLSFDTTTEPL